MFSFRIEGFEVDRSGKPAPLYLKECIYIYISFYLSIYLSVYVSVKIAHSQVIYEDIVLPGFAVF